MPDRPTKSGERAEAAFKQAQKAARESDKSKAMMEYEAEAGTARAKTARLKELRLAKEAADSAAKSKPKAAPRKKKSPSAS